MNRIACSRLFPQKNRMLFQALAARYSVDTGKKEHIDGLVKDNKVVVFMKGTAEQPKCGFSNAVVQILNFHGVNNFSYHNILDDEQLRQGTC